MLYACLKSSRPTKAEFSWSRSQDDRKGSYQLWRRCCSRRACHDTFASNRIWRWTRSSDATGQRKNRTSERSWYQILWLLAKGQTARGIAVSPGYSPYWLGQIAKRSNAEGPAGMINWQYTHSHRAEPLLSAQQLVELAEAVRGPAQPLRATTGWGGRWRPG